ncbi:MAG: hypothetical protein ACI87N_000887 [Flavobacteriales bacterium]|jgi:hypothetical protein
MDTKIILLFLVLALVSCKNSDSDKNEKEKIKMAHWLLGTWENKSADGVLSEIWTKTNDSTYQAQSFFIKGKDTIHFETIVLQQVGEDLTYSANIKGQNEDKPVAFSLAETTENQLVFENQKHDYPQKISYQKAANNNLVTTISGLVNGKTSAEKYTLVKN